ncbi:hypothetical protein CLOM_g3928 [Closterium sp. NIES-68]|nr:hypothetical protein CLOM_g3928 [Closterium sp. NIES-68]
MWVLRRIKSQFQQSQQQSKPRLDQPLSFTTVTDVGSASKQKKPAVGSVSTASSGSASGAGSASGSGSGSGLWKAMPEGVRKYYVVLLNLILLFLIAWQASPYASSSYYYGASAGGKWMMLSKDSVLNSVATDAKEASLDSSEWSLSDKLVAGRPEAVAGDGTGSHEGGSGSAGGGKPFPEVKEELEHICWTSSDRSKGHTLVPRSHLPRGVVVGGRGCAGCVRGKECGMRVWINAPASWVQVYPNASWWKKDMTLILKGPSLSHGDVRCLDPPACTQFALTYRLWDVGQYRAFLGVGCANLRFAPNYKQHLSQTHLHVVTSWNLTITPQKRDALWANSSLAAPATAAATLPLFPAAAAASSAATAATTVTTAAAAAAGTSATAATAATAANTADVNGEAVSSKAISSSSSSSSEIGDNTNQSISSGAATNVSSSTSLRRFLSVTSQEEVQQSEERSRGRGTEGRGLLEIGTKDEGEEDEDEEKLPVTPCQVSGIKGRWVLSKTGGFEWRFFPCSPKEPKQPSGWVSQLVRKGIHEINIVGDSHQRVLSFHLRYLLSGFADERMVRSHEDMNFTLTDERTGKQLRVNFYWVDGIYRNREYGCVLRGQYTHNYHTFPNISTTANVTVIEGGYWAGKWCAEPLQALRARLPSTSSGRCSPPAPTVPASCSGLHRPSPTPAPIARSTLSRGTFRGPPRTCIWPQPIGTRDSWPRR